jgi:hypothetical protein
VRVNTRPPLGFHLRRCYRDKDGKRHTYGALKNPQAQRGYSRDHRPDCKQVNIALVDVVLPAAMWWKLGHVPVESKDCILQTAEVGSGFRPGQAVNHMGSNR